MTTITGDLVHLLRSHGEHDSYRGDRLLLDAAEAIEQPEHPCATPETCNWPRCGCGRIEQTEPEYPGRCEHGLHRHSCDECAPNPRGQ